MNTRRIRFLRRKSWFGKLIRMPFRLIPAEATLPVLSGPLKGKKWIKGSHNISVVLGTYERSQSRKFFDYATKADVFWDLGSHVGYYSLLYAAANPRGTIYAIEPLDKNAAYFKRHMQLNGVSNSTLFPVAVSNTTGKLSFNTATTTVAGKLSEKGDKLVEVVKLSSWLDEGRLLPPDLIKMDIEGEEFKVLTDLKECLLNHKPVLFLSTHGIEIHEKCLALLSELGYDMKPLDAQTLELSKELIAVSK